MIILLIPLAWLFVCWLFTLSAAGWVGLAATWEVASWATDPARRKKKSQEVSTGVGVFLIGVAVVLFAVVIAQTTPEAPSRAVTFPLSR